MKTETGLTPEQKQRILTATGWIESPTAQPSELDAIRARVTHSGKQSGLQAILDRRRLLELLDESTAKINLFQIGICNMQGLTDAELGASIRTTASMEGSETVKTLLGIFDAKDSEIESLEKERDESKRKLAITDGVIRGLLNDQRLGLNMRDFLEQTLKRIE